MRQAVLLVLLLACQTVACQTASTMNITSTFTGEIPVRYTCDGADVNPPLTIRGVPAGTESLALIVDDPDAPLGTWTHWVVWNIPVGDIAENSVPGEQGTNSWGKNAWGGPCPPSGTHRYRFTVYALDTKLDLPPATTSDELKQAMRGHELARGTLTGHYQRTG
ncbi:YbhB/YbcL family Raf kinase inhibitor-like protein [Candidatus Woesearchaeota archaeon]|nr:MAG: YbhB/YbcL family Raf kinase inhibitor-like protein [Candidatus Woesearchaeota archaeon]